MSRTLRPSDQPVAVSPAAKLRAALWPRVQDTPVTAPTPRANDAVAVLLLRR